MDSFTTSWDRNPVAVRLTEENQEVDAQVGTLADWMQSGGSGEVVGSVDELPKVEEKGINVPGELLPSEGLRLSNTRDAMPELIAGLRRWRGLTQAQLGAAIGYQAPVVGNIEQSSRKLRIKTPGGIFNALGWTLYRVQREEGVLILFEISVFP